MPQPIVVVDAFADRPFAGNPAGVCVLTQPADPAWMALVAREMNLAETAFLHPKDDGFGLRWFTPVAEVDLCGHATLASAHVLWQEGWLALDAEARFHTRSGVLTARRTGAMIELDFPAEPAEARPAPAELLPALGLKGAEWTGVNRMDLLVQVGSAAELRGLSPDMGVLARLGTRGVIVTARAEPGSGADFLSRFFAPGVGVPEDPVTGSAHCALAPFWAERLGRPELVGYQASARGGTVRVALKGNRVRLTGQAMTILRGTIADRA
jgi:PhzF family phenazine biosynthesis protein